MVNDKWANRQQRAPFSNVNPPVATVTAVHGQHPGLAAITTDGQLWVCGAIWDFRNPNPTYTPVSGPTRVTSVTADASHLWAVDRTGRLWRTHDSSLAMIDVGVAGAEAAKISAGDYHHVVLDTDGELWAWSNTNNDWACGGTNTAGVHERVQDPKGRHAKDIVAGSRNTYIAYDNGDVDTWGTDPLGRGGRDPTTIACGIKFIAAEHNTIITIGDDNTITVNSPNFGVNSTDMLDVPIVSVAAGALHQVAVDATGTLWGRGNVLFGHSSWEPVDIGAVRAATCGTYSVTVVSTDGVVYHLGTDGDPSGAGNNGWSTRFTPIELGTDTAALAAELSSDTVDIYDAYQMARAAGGS